MLELSEEEASSLQLIDLYCDFKRQRGQGGRAPVSNYKKMSVVRAEWRRSSPHDTVLTDRARVALRWFMEHPTYRRFHDKHQACLEERKSKRRRRPCTSSLRGYCLTWMVSK